MVRIKTESFLFFFVFFFVFLFVFFFHGSNLYSETCNTYNAITYATYNKVRLPTRTLHNTNMTTYNTVQLFTYSRYLHYLQY